MGREGDSPGSVQQYKSENLGDLTGANVKLLQEEAGSDAVDLEAASGISAAEYHIPASTKCLHLSLYFSLNLALTIYNKAVLDKVRPTCRPFEKSVSIATGKALLTACHDSSPSRGCLRLYIPAQHQSAATYCYQEDTSS